MIRLRELTTYLEELAPLAYQEDYDNSGLLTGTPDMVISQALISLDCTEPVLDEAIRLGCNLIISHHPIVFRGLKRFTGNTYVERVITKAIKHDIALYAIHTNLDNVTGGVNSRIALQLGLQQPAVLAPKAGLLHKLVVFIPKSHAALVQDAIFAAGAGHIGNYSECSFQVTGSGTFKAGENTDPFVGTQGERHQEEEVRLETIFPVNHTKQVLKALLEAHPYEEVAYDLYPLQNRFSEVGSGMVGNLPEPMEETAFLAFLKERLNATVIRHTELCGRPVRRVAVCGGAGGFLLHDAKRAGADFFVTADYKYHEFFDADGRIVIADVGHFESEQFTQDLLLEIIQKKFPNFAIRLTGVKTNPIKYYV